MLVLLPPTSTLFPYTTLFRSCCFWCSLRYDWQRDFHQFCAWSWRFLNNWFGSDSFFNHRCDYRFFGYARSEERFSRNAETDLVCRLLLEKKKEADTNL